MIESLHFLTDHNPLGVRGVGEGATGPPPTVIANAMSDAFDGRLDITTPVLTPDRVYALLRVSRVATDAVGATGGRT